MCEVCYFRLSVAGQAASGVDAELVVHCHEALAELLMLHLCNTLLGPEGVGINQVLAVWQRSMER